MRKVFLNIHLFKNAGTSIDAVLAMLFGQPVVKTEFNPYGVNQSGESLEQWIRSHENSVTFSSHTVPMPLPIVDDIEIFPIIFIRHPLERLVSVYRFERWQGQQGVRTFGAKLAKNTNLGGYLETRLALTNDRQCRNYHSYFLSRILGGDIDDELISSLKALDTLPCVGVVDLYPESIFLLLRQLGMSSRYTEAASIRRNVMNVTITSVGESIEQIRSEIGSLLFGELEDANKIDLLIHEKHSRDVVHKYSMAVQRN